MRGLAEHIPNIGYFIKWLSNGFYKLKGYHKEYSGLGLLNPVQIKAIPVDVSWHLQEYKVSITQIGSVVSIERVQCKEKINTVGIIFCHSSHYK